MTISQEKLELLTPIEIPTANYIEAIINLGYLLHKKPDSHKQLLAINQIYTGLNLAKYDAFLFQNNGDLELTIPYPNEVDDFLDFRNIKASKNLLATNNKAPTIVCELGWSAKIMLRPYQIPELIELVRDFETLWAIDESIPLNFYNEDKDKVLTFTGFKTYVKTQLEQAKKGA